MQALVEQWRRLAPEVIVDLQTEPRLAELGPRASLTLYRFVQEGLTNAFRHAQAARIVVRIAYETASASAPPSDPQLAGLRARVEDDGQGVAESQAPGMGLSGLRDRVRALGGISPLAPRRRRELFIEARFGLAK